MARSFFQPGERSRCMFTPDLWCDHFEYNHPHGNLEFLCNVESQTVGIVLSPSDQGSPIGNEMPKLIRKAWGDRQVGFKCQFIQEEAWTSPKPCEACALIRTAQVTIIDLNGSPRAIAFLDLAVSSENLIQQLLIQKADSVPTKKTIGVPSPKIDIPPHYRYALDIVDYPANNDVSTLGGFFQKMLTLARHFFASLTSDSVIDMSELSQSSPTMESSNLEDIPIRILDDDHVQETETENISGSIADMAEREEVKRQFELLQQVIEQAGKTDPKKEGLSRAAEHMDTGNYVDAILMFHKLQSTIKSEDTYSFESNNSIEFYIKFCTEKLKPHEIVQVFFSVGDKSMPQRFSLSRFKIYTEFIETVLEIRYFDNNLLLMLRAPEQGYYVPIRIYENITEDLISTWYNEASESKLYSVFMVSANVSDEKNIGLSRINCRDLSNPPLNIVELKLDDMKKHIVKGEDGFEYVVSQIKAIRGESYEPYEKTTPVSKDNEFFGRKQTIERIVDRIQRSNPFYICGRLRSGKTSLINRLKELSELRDYLAISIELPWSDNIITHFYKIVSSIKEAVKDRYPESQYPSDKFNALNLSRFPIFSMDEAFPESRWRNQFLDDFPKLVDGLVGTSELGCRKVVLLLDEFDHVLRAGGYMEFMNILRRLGPPEFPKILVGIVSLGRFLKEIRDPNSQAYGRFHEFLMDNLEFIECKELVETIGRKYLLYYDDMSLNAIYCATGGDPLMTRRLCDLIFTILGARGGSVNESHVHECIYTCLKNNRSFLHDIYAEFLKLYFSDEAELIKEIAAKSDIGGMVSFSILKHTFKVRRWTLERLQTAIDNLVRLQLIGQVSTYDGYCIKMELLHHVLKQEESGSDLASYWGSFINDTL